VSIAARQWSLERAVQAAIVATIVLAVLASGSIQSWIPTARRLRWAALLALVVLAVLWAWRRRGAIRVWPLATAGSFLALGLLSAAWSVAPRETVGRAIALAAVLAAAAALAVATSRRREAAERVLDAVVVAAGAVALGGLVVLLVDYDRAVAQATSSLPARYQGLGGGPNTMTMLLAVALPPAVYVALEGRGVRRAVGVLVALGSLASIIASGSRGALAAAFAGCLVLAVLRAPSPRRAVAAAAVAAAVFAVGLGLSQLPDPAGADASALPVAADPTPPPVEAVRPYVWVDRVLRLQDDVGHPPPGVAATDDEGRPLLGSSGRVEAWLGALRQAADRPVAGYGFGTEEEVFVDRYVGFNSQVPENSYVGIVLQLGAIGLVTLLAIAVALAAPLRTRRNALAAACAGVLAAGLVLAFFQSFLYAPGNNATAALWICSFLLAAANE
jgi:O-antigen ligase